MLMVVLLLEFAGDVGDAIFLDADNINGDNQGKQGKLYVHSHPST